MNEKQKHLILDIAREQYIKYSRRNTNLDIKSSIFATLVMGLIGGLNMLDLKYNFSIDSVTTFFILSNICLFLCLGLLLINLLPSERNDISVKKIIGSKSPYKIWYRDIIDNYEKNISIQTDLNRKKSVMLKRSGGLLILSLFLLFIIKLLTV